MTVVRLSLSLLYQQKRVSFRVLESKLKFLEVESNLVLLFLTKPFNFQVS